MIDSPKLLAALQRQVADLLLDLEQRADMDGPVKDYVNAEYEAARQAGRTAYSKTQWRKELLVQGAVAWVLASVFVRFMEDNHLIDEVWLSGVGARRDVARGRRQRHFEEHPHDTDREVLQRAFRAAAQLPAVAGLFDEAHNPLWRLPISGDAASRLIGLWDAIDDASEDVRPVFDFTDPQRGTRFLGDLYQDLSEDAKKRFALLQTPIFVESFILDRTLTPALGEYGLPAVKVIDPTCGSGHFLIGAFERLFAAWQDRESSVPAPELAQRALWAVHGVDLNPFAVAIARFRLIVAALNACGIKRLAHAPAWELRLACGDSLLHGPREGQLSGIGTAIAIRGLEHHFLTEDAGLVEEILTPGYHVVVGNPPYIVANDKALNEAYRERYPTCKGSYSLAVPFMERFFQLARLPADGGYVGQITANSFMKREFGTRLIEEFLPTVDLQTLIDAAGAYIPGHGTPTVIVVGRARRPVLATVRAVMGIRGEPSPPTLPADGLVWRAIVEQVDQPGSESAFVSVADLARTSLSTHPWSLQGGGATDLVQRLAKACPGRLGDVADEFGFGAVTRENDVYLLDRSTLRRWDLPDSFHRQVVTGDRVRDWRADESSGMWPYDADTLEASKDQRIAQVLWPWRKQLSVRVAFGKTQLERGLPWTAYSMFFQKRFAPRLKIAYAFVATHNHFILDRRKSVFIQSAPLIKLPAGASEDEHLGLLGVLNSATACFWLQQVCHNKGAGGGARVDAGYSAMGEEPWMSTYEFTGTKLAEFPLPARRHPALANRIDEARADRAKLLDEIDLLLADRNAFEQAAVTDVALYETAIFLQEELDWATLASFGLVDDDVVWVGEDVPVKLGQRAFEIRWARQLAAGGRPTKWFTKFGGVATTEPPPTWPADYRRLVEARIALVESDRQVALLEAAETKRRWEQPSWAEREGAAVRAWLLDHIEALPLWQREELITCSQVADDMRHDPRVRHAVQRLAGSIDADLDRVVQDLIVAESVPYLATHRYKDSGMATRSEWEQVWDLQRNEDAVDALGLPADRAARRKADEVGDIPIPPKYKPADFRKTDYWRLRGKLDVPKERFVLVPEGSRTGDPSPVVGWAGWDHATLAFALASRASLLRSHDGAGEERLVPLLAGILELLPWVAQWHPDPDPKTGEQPARELEDFLADELGAIGRTRDDLRAWRPPAPTRGRRAR